MVSKNFRDPTHEERDRFGLSHDGCDCTELCSMGPTCPGGALAGLPGTGCWRTHQDKATTDLLAALGRAVDAARAGYAPRTDKSDRGEGRGGAVSEGEG